MKVLSSVLFLAFCLLSVPVFAEKPAELDQMRFEFEVELAELVKPLAELNTKYREHLGKQKAAFQQAGNLEAVLAVDAEIKIFEADLTKEFSSIPELKRLQQIYREQKRKLNNDLIGKKAPLIRSCSEKMKELSVQWTKEGRLDEAKLALDESKRIAAVASDFPIVSASPTGSGADNREAGEQMSSGLKMKLCWIPAGKFLMGSPEGEVGRDPARESQVDVELTSGFWMGRYEVTQEEYEKVTGTNPAMFKNVGKRAPVERVDWEEAMAFCRALTEREKKRRDLPDGWIYTLPTDAQWEYACRAGEIGPFSGGELDEVGWHKGNGGGRTHEVGEKKANAWGLYDMHGNVKEWCRDWFAETLTGGQDPPGPASGTSRVFRGGGRANLVPDCRSAKRRGYPSGKRGHDVGFRVCLRPVSN